MRPLPIITLLLAFCWQGAWGQHAARGLKDVYQDYFPIGVAVAPRNVNDPEAALILQQFSSLTTENALKFGPVHPEEQRYNWEGADSIVNFAVAHHLKVRGHTFAGISKRPPGCL